MAKSKTKQRDAPDLRSLAEKRLAEKQTAEQPHAREQDQDPRKLIHDLQVHHIELEMQNDELLQTRSEIEELLDKYADLYDFAPVGYFTITADGIIREVNLTGAALLGEDRACLINRRFDLHISTATHAALFAFYHKVFEGATKASCEVMLARDSHNPRHIHIEGAVMVSGQSSIGRHCFMVALDITDRKRVESALFQKTEEMEHFFNVTLDLLCIADTDGYFRQLNQAWERTLGFTHEELIDKRFFDFIHPDDVERTQEALSRLASGRDVVNFINRYRCKDGTYRWIEWNTTPSGKLVYGAAHDITESKHMEEGLAKAKQELEIRVAERTSELRMANEQLQRDIIERLEAQAEKERIENLCIQSQKMEALGRFAGGIAHDLNNLLYPIIINTEYLLEDAVPGTIIQDTLYQVLSAAFRQRDMVKQILTFSRGCEQKFMPIKIVPLITEALNFIRSSLPSTITIQHAIDTPIDRIIGDPTQIHQIIMNLCRNAADAMESQHGLIDVRLSYTFLGSDSAYPDLPAGKYLLLSVKDTGSGIKPEAIDHIFEPFFTTKEIGKGSGMGLAIVHGIIKTHGGAITVQSEPGKGSLFHIYLPLYEEDVRARAPYDEQDTTLESKYSILIVDDEEIILSSLQRALNRSGHTVVAVKDSRKALRIFDEAPQAFDLVITDLTMPGITGLELTQRLLGIRPNIPVILCTGYNEVINEQELKALGIRELLLKPSGTRELCAAVQRAFEK